MPMTTEQAQALAQKYGGTFTPSAGTGGQPPRDAAFAQNLAQKYGGTFTPSGSSGDKLVNSLQQDLNDHAQKLSSPLNQSLASKLMGRVSDIGQAATLNTSFLQNPLKAAAETVERPLRAAGAVAGGIGDILGSAGQWFGDNVLGKLIDPAAHAAAQALPQGAKDAMKASVQAGLAAPHVQAAIGAIKAGSDAYDKFAKANPNAAKDVESLLNVASLMGGGEAKGAETALGKAAEGANKALADIAKGGLEKAAAGVEKAGEMAGEGATHLVSHATALNPETVKIIVNNPKEFERASMAANDRYALASKVKSGLEELQANKSDVGSAYSTVRELATPVQMKPTTVSDVLAKHGLSLGADGKIAQTAESVPLSAGDKAAIEHFASIYGPEQVKSPNAFMNARKALDEMANFGRDATKTDASDKIARDLRSAYDAQGKDQISGLKELDAEYAPMAKQWKQISRDFLTPDGKELKDNAISKIANLTGKGKENVLARLEEVVPGITKDINIVKAMEDVEYSKGHKVGAYSRALVGMGGGAHFGGPVGAVVGGLLAHPSVATWMLRQYGSKFANTRVIERIVGALESGAKLVGNDKNLMGKILNEAAVNLVGPHSQEETQ